MALSVFDLELRFWFPFLYFFLSLSLFLSFPFTYKPSFSSPSFTYYQLFSYLILIFNSVFFSFLIIIMIFSVLWIVLVCTVCCSALPKPKPLVFDPSLVIFNYFWTFLFYFLFPNKITIHWIGCLETWEFRLLISRIRWGVSSWQLIQISISIP